MAGINTREIVLEMLISIDKGEEFSHIMIRNVLDKYDYLESVDKSFIKRVTEGTIERRITIDYIINSVSSTPVHKMKPLIRNLMRMSTYQIMYMDKVPDSAACNEAVKLAGKRGFRTLAGFVNGVLRNISRNKDKIKYPDKDRDIMTYLSVVYSCPVLIVESFLKDYGPELTEEMLKSSLDERRLYVRVREDITAEDKAKVIDEWKNERIEYVASSVLPYAYWLRKSDGIGRLKAFQNGLITVQDISSMMVSEAAATALGIGSAEANERKEDILVLDMCAAPGGKSLHMASKLRGQGRVIARDVNDYKIGLIEENVSRMGANNIDTQVYDATVMDDSLKGRIDCVLLDAPCSGLGVIGRKPDIKLNITEESLNSIVGLQQKIIDNAVSYLRPGGVLVYSTCSVRKSENNDNAEYIRNKHGLKPALDEALVLRLTKSNELSVLVEEGQALQLLLNEAADGFYIAVFRKE